MGDPSVAAADIDEYCDKLEDELEKERALSDRLADLLHTVRKWPDDAQMDIVWLETVDAALAEHGAMREGSSQASEA